MSQFWQVLVSIGAWTHAHQTFVLAGSATVVVLLGLLRLTWRTTLHARRPPP